MIPSAMSVKTNSCSSDRVPASTFLIRPSGSLALDKTKDASPRFVKWSDSDRKMLPLCPITSRLGPDVAEGRQFSPDSLGGATGV